MPAEVDKYFSPTFSWWTVVTAEKCNVGIIFMDFKTFDIAVVGDDIGKQKFRDEYNRVFNNVGAMLAMFGR